MQQHWRQPLKPHRVHRTHISSLPSPYLQLSSPPQPLPWNHLQITTAAGLPQFCSGGKMCAGVGKGFQTTKETKKAHYALQIFFIDLSKKKNHVGRRGSVAKNTGCSPRWPDSVPRTYRVTYNHLQFQYPGSAALQRAALTDSWQPRLLSRPLGISVPGNLHANHQRANFQLLGKVCF